MPYSLLRRQPRVPRRTSASTVIDRVRRPAAALSLRPVRALLDRVETMQSEFLMADSQRQYDAPFKLQQAGYSATSGDTSRGPTIRVEHAFSQLGHVEAIVFAIDPGAQRY